MQRRLSSLAAMIAFVFVAGVDPSSGIAQDDLPGTEPPASDADDGPLPTDRTPPRLSHIDGKASFWRQGAEEWTEARVNTPLAPGDQLYVDNGSNLEMQIGPRDFVRVASNSQLAFDNDEAAYQQFRLTSGQASVDLRGLRAGQTVELDTPNGAFTIDHNGYYRVNVDEDATHFATRRGGRATLTPANGDPEDISPSEAVVVRGDEVESYAASEPDAWDRWNYDRSDQLVEAVSYRHVPENVYGVDDLDHSGRWRSVPRYGSVWFPSNVASSWAPYTTGRWVLDPYYGWTWIDDAPWGWAPFHYGRWVHVDRFWGWAPGPIVARPYYAPALVAFFSAGPISIGVSLGNPVLGWTPLGWGEPCRPWWGSRHYMGRPRWFGWGGPRVNIHQTVVNNINVYQNVRVNNGLVVVNRDRFGRGDVREARIASANRRQLSEIRGALPVQSDPVRVVGGAPRGQRPPESMLDRRVVATRASAAPSSSRGFFRRSDAPPNPPAQLVPGPREARARGTRQGASSTAARSVVDATNRPDARRSGAQHAARSSAPAPPAALRSAQNGGDPREVARSATRRSAPRFESRRSAAASPSARVDSPRPARQPAAVGRSHGGSPRAEARSMPSPRVEPPRATRQPSARQQGGSPRASRELPGQPANRVWAGRSNGGGAPNAAPRNNVSPRRAPREDRASSGRQPRQMAAQQAVATPQAEAADSGARVRGHRQR